MPYHDLLVLIPSHGLEDFPTDLGDEAAASLLNAFAVVWHPRLLREARRIPRWHRSDIPPAPTAGQLILVPAACHDWLPHGWVDEARESGATVLTETHDRQTLLDNLFPSHLFSGPDAPPPLDAELTADFLALGTAILQLELLSRQMRHFSSLDELILQRYALVAADALAEGRLDEARDSLRSCFENLQETRERFYPVECFLLDLCLLTPGLANEHLATTLADDHQLNVLVTANDFQTILEADPAWEGRFRTALLAERLEIVGGEDEELPLPLLPLDSVLHHFQWGANYWRERLQVRVRTHARRRFGLTAALPQLLQQQGIPNVLHVAFDDGIYPDSEQSRYRWQGTDGTTLDAWSRIPLAADSPATYLRFAQRMGESMDNDAVAGIAFARWPEVTAPWFGDFLRIARYAPVFGRFASCREFLESQDSMGKLARTEVREYLSPFLSQAVALRKEDPVGRFADHTLRRRHYSSVEWCETLQLVLSGQPASEITVEEALEKGHPEAAPPAIAAAVHELAAYDTAVLPSLAKQLLAGAPAGAGFLLLNPTSIARTVAVPLPGLASPPAVGPAVRAVQWEGPRQGVVVTLPPSGYVWIPRDEGAKRPAAGRVPMAEPGVLRNDLLEVVVNEETGGVASIRRHNQRENRLSQQIAYRFPRERSIRLGDGEDAEVVKTQYSEMRCFGQEVVTNGPACAEIVTTGDVIDSAQGERLCTFRQTVRLWTGRPVVEIDIRLDDLRAPDAEPWNNYWAARFAWNDPASSVTRSLWGQAHPHSGERLESADYVELATRDYRTTLIPHGLPFHRKTGPRMLDTILVVAGESRRDFRFSIAVDEPYPMEAAAAELSPVFVVPTTSGPPRPGATAWLLHVAHRNVQVTRLRPLLDDSTGHVAGVLCRVVETEGQARTTTLRLFRPAATASKQNFLGEKQLDLAVENGDVVVPLHPQEIVDVAIRF